MSEETSPNTDTAAGLALVTGASSGIGRALVQQFVDHGYDVVVTAEDAELHTAAAQLRESGRQVLAVQVDLTRPEEVEQLWREATALGRPITAAALNAGVGVGGGTFAETALDRHLALVDLNVRSTVHLAKLLVDHMVAQGEGRILVTSSVAAVAPGPYQATYNASKAFGHSFAEAIRHELKGTGVTVTSLMPGPTDTEFFERADMEATPLAQGSKDSPEQVAADGFAALMAGKPHVVAGSLKNRVLAEVATHLPDRVGTAAFAAQTKPKQ
ncbi:SDR family NAD(P)-dependent oxidoreductase [Nocardioides ferulae]|uniref:SDR family NAD(P)-dependent oxidoreductase n=1 Tax=Nocardioides ferulae TaxID=2340821 RepID=UPI000EAF57C5|nr:SDR family NAD(P)-dependent oxidoreductase [Nocardioides ferulae]